MSKEMIFFHSGETVRLKQDIPNKPTMLVKRVVKTHKVSADEVDQTFFIGVKCFWFTETGQYQEQIFNSKDLEKC